MINIEEGNTAVKVLLVGLDTGGEQDFAHSMEELGSLAEAACKEVVGSVVQRLPAVNKAFYIGTGKVEEVREQAERYGHSLRREFAFLVAHSMLHLCGYDHMEDAEAEVMERKQEETLSGLGITRDVC